MSNVLIEKPDAQISVIRLNRPEKLNAMSVELMTELYDALQTVAHDNHTRVCILTGAGRGFCSGLDLDDQSIIPNIDGLSIPRIAMRAIEHYSKVVPAMRRIPQPIICAINGVAYGGGMCLTMGADIRIAAASAVFNSTGIVNGLTSTELGVSWLLPRLIGAAHANDIMLTGRTLDAQEAYRMGLVSRVVADDAIMGTALEMARDMCKFSPHGLSMTKSCAWANLEISSFETAVELENRNQILLGMTNNLPEAMQARKQNRKPEYTDDLRNFAAF